jgi:hypothetical protein
MKELIFLLEGSYQEVDLLDLTTTLLIGVQATNIKGTALMTTDWMKQQNSEELIFNTKSVKMIRTIPLHALGDLTKRKGVLLSITQDTSITINWLLTASQL